VSRLSIFDWALSSHPHAFISLISAERRRVAGGSLAGTFSRFGVGRFRIVGAGSGNSLLYKEDPLDASVDLLEVSAEPLGASGGPRQLLTPRGGWLLAPRRGWSLRQTVASRAAASHGERTVCGASNLFVSIKTVGATRYSSSRG
jgi:hypothetical protein